jgi:putative ABC transport system permease protein
VSPINVEPPRLAIALGRALIHERVREAVLGDLVEGFRSEGAPTFDAARARRWFWRQVLLAIVRFPIRPPLPKGIAATGLVDDLSGALRTLRRAPASTLLSAVTLAVGIGAATAIFSVADPIIIRPLPYQSPDQVYAVWQNDPNFGRDNVGYLTFADLTAGSTSFQSTAAVGGWGPVLTRNGTAEQLSGLRVSWTYFRTLGVSPALGADFTHDDDAPSRNSVVMLSHALWRSRFGGDSAVVGSFATINGIPMRVAGVMAADYDDVLAPGVQIWRVLGYDATLPYACRTCHHLRMLARLAPSVTEASALAQADAVSARLVHDFPHEYSAPGFQMVRLQNEVTRPVRPALGVLLAGVVLLLLIATANVASLQLARAHQRDEEFAVRAALGAGAGRLMRQLMAEGLVLAAVAGVLALVVADVGLRELVSSLPGSIPRLSAVHLDLRAFGVAALATVATGLGIGLTPAWHARRGALAVSLNGSRRVAGARHRVRGALVVSEVAVAVVLLAGAGLLARSFLTLLAVNPGFDVGRVATAQVQVNGPRYPDSTSVWAWQDRLLRGVQAIPGVESAALGSQLPLGGNMDGYGVQALDKPLANPELAPSADRYTVTTGYLKTMGIPVVEGRDFEAADNGVTGAPVAIVSRSLARRIWGAESPIGKEIHCGEPARPWYTVVGVAGDVHHQGLDVSETLQLYVPTRRWFFTDQGVDVVVRTAGTPAAVLPSLRRAVLEPDRETVITRLATMSDVRGRSTAQRSLVLALFAVFAAVALLLATAGLFGALAGAVAERRREIGLRSALGATPRDIVALVIRQGAIMAGGGAVVGMAVALAGAGMIRAMLFGVGSGDLVTIAGVATVIGTAAIGASVVPAWRAVRMDPVAALRAD